MHLIVQLRRMAATEGVCSEFLNWEVNTATVDGSKQEKHISAAHRKYYSFCRRKVGGYLAYLVHKNNNPNEKSPVIQTLLCKHFEGN